MRCVPGTAGAPGRKSVPARRWGDSIRPFCYGSRMQPLDLHPEVTMPWNTPAYANCGGSSTCSSRSGMDVRTRRDVKNGTNSGDVYENTGVATKCTPINPAFYMRMHGMNDNSLQLLGLIDRKFDNCTITGGKWRRFLENGRAMSGPRIIFGRGHCSRIQQILGANFLEFLHILLPVVPDARGAFAAAERFHDLVASYQTQRVIQFEVLRREPPDCREKFHSHFRGLQRLTVEQDDLHAMANLAGENAGERLEIHGHKTYSLNLLVVQIRGQRSAVDPGSAHQFEGRVGAAAQADVGAFHETDAGVKSLFRQVAQIRGGADPRLARLIKPVRALPVLHLDHVQLGVQVIFAVEHLRQFSHGHAVANGHGKVADKGMQVRVQYGTIHLGAVNGVRPVEDEELDPLFPRRLQAISQRGDVSVEARAHILNIKNQGVDALEHLGAGPLDFTIQAVDGQAGRGVAGGVHL